MPIKLANNASGTLATAISASDTGIALATGNGALFPTLSAGEYFYLTLTAPSGAFEIVKATARVGDALTVVRAQEGTTAIGFPVGSRVELRVTAAAVNDRVDEAELLTTTLQSGLAAATGASLVGFLQSGTSAVPTTVQAKLRETVSVKDFGAVGNGVADDTAAIQAAVDYCKTQTVLDHPTQGGATLYFPRGTYIVSSTIDLAAMYGFYLQGEGAGNTNIVFTGGASTLFRYNTYVRCGISDMTLSAGTVTGGDTLVPAAKVGTCVNFNSSVSGVDFTFNRVVFQYWDVVLRTKDSTVNGDTHTHNQCGFYSNNIVWDNANSQAVVWAFYSCRTFNNGICFNNPGNNLVVVGGDWINPGDFLVGGSVVSTTSQSIFKGLRFENFQNINPTSTPRLLVLSGTTGSVSFENCIAGGGGSLAGKTASNLSGIFDVTLKNCIFDGNWNVSVSASANGISSRMVFEECPTMPTVVQSLNPGQGNIPINLHYINCRIPGKITAYMTKRFRGASFGQTASLPVETLSDGIKIESTINNSSSGKDVEVFLPSPYQLAFVGADIFFRAAIAAAVTINVWDSSAKASLLGTVNTAASTAWQALSITPTAVAFLTSTTNVPYVEMTSAGNAGICSLSISLKFRQV
jgi:hypothetical protein